MTQIGVAPTQASLGDEGRNPRGALGLAGFGRLQHHVGQARSEREFGQRLAMGCKDTVGGQGPQAAQKGPRLVEGGGRRGI